MDSTTNPKKTESRSWIEKGQRKKTETLEKKGGGTHLLPSPPPVTAGRKTTRGAGLTGARPLSCGQAHPSCRRLAWTCARASGLGHRHRPTRRRRAPCPASARAGEGAVAAPPPPPPAATGCRLRPGESKGRKGKEEGGPRPCAGGAAPHRRRRAAGMGKATQWPPPLGVQREGRRSNELGFHGGAAGRRVLIPRGSRRAV